MRCLLDSLDEEDFSLEFWGGGQRRRQHRPALDTCPSWISEEEVSLNTTGTVFTSDKLVHLKVY